MSVISFIHYTDTNTVEVAWGDLIEPATDEAPAKYRQTRCHSYADAQMGMLEADLGEDAADYADLIATVRSAIPVPTTEQLAAQLAKAKTAKNLQINEWRAQANQSHFTHTGKQIACDALSRSDIDAVANAIALTGAFPAGFPGAWKAMDNSYVMLPDIDAFKAMFASMTGQGTANFAHSQSLKAAVASATTVDQVNAIVW